MPAHPLIKGVLTDTGFANTVMRAEMFGGHGYIAEHAWSSSCADARIAMIYEGANGIPGAHLVGRQIAEDGAAPYRRFLPRCKASSRSTAPTRR